jgi:hypothetical protein
LAIVPGFIAKGCWSKSSSRWLARTCALSSPHHASSAPHVAKPLGASGGRTLRWEATPVQTTPSLDARALALRTTDALGSDLVGVDLLPSPDGHHVVIELNGAAEFDDADSFPGSDLYRDAATALELLPASTMGAPPAAAGLP